MADKMVAGTPTLGIGLPEPTPQQSGTPQGAPTQVPVDAQPSVEELKGKLAKYEQDVRALKSTFDRKYSEAETGWSQERDELTRRLDALAVAGMSDQERQEYDIEQLRIERDRLRENYAQAQAQIEYERQQMAYLSWLNSLGVDVAKLDYTDQSTFGQTAATALQEHIAGLKAELEQYKTGPKPAPAPTKPEPGPQVFTGGGTTTTGQPTFEDFRKYVSDKLGRPATDEDVFYAHERKWIDLNKILPPQT